MLIFGQRATAPAHTGATSPLLRVIAGKFAPAIAQMWPAPHRPFMEAGADRRHIICLVLDALEVGSDAHLPEAPSLARTLSSEAIRQLIRRFLPRTVEGLPRALQRMGETAWTSAEYRSLLRLFEDADAAKLLRHADAIAPAYVATLDLLPPPLRSGRVPHLATDPAVVMLVVETYSAIRRSRPAEDAEAVWARWRRAETLERLFEMAREDLTPRVLPATPFPDHPDLRWLGTTEAMAEAGRRFCNCVATYAMRAAAGDIVVYEWLGSPGAILSIARDPVWGWRLEEARIHNNDSVPVEARPIIMDAMREWGVHLVRGGHALASTLDWATTDATRAASATWSECEVFGY